MPLFLWRRAGGATTASSGAASAAPVQRERRRPAARRGLRARWRAWWLARHPVAETWTLGQRNIYILPTKGGWVFALTLLVMLLSAINYQLNLGYVLTFLLAGSGLVSIHGTHGSLRGLTLRLRATPPVFAGEPAPLEVVMANPGAARHGIGLRLYERRHALLAWCDVPAQGQTSATLRFVPRTRGWHVLPALLMETRFPFGLFRAWTHWRPAGQLLAYPRPEAGAPALPGTRSASGGGPSLPRQGPGGELDGVRAWRRGDAMRQIAWKKAARSGQLVSRETTAETRSELWLDWAGAASAGDAEARLSRLAAWVLMAERDGRVYGLRLPGRSFAPDRGEAHQRRLLRELALWH